MADVNSSFKMTNTYGNASNGDLSSASENESVIDKVKNAVSKLFHPSFSFSSTTEKRKRPSMDDVSDDKREDENNRQLHDDNDNDNNNTDSRQTSTVLKSNLSRFKTKKDTSFQTNTVRFADEQLRLTDDEDSNDNNQLNLKDRKQLYYPQTKRPRTITNGDTSKIPELTIPQTSSITFDINNRTTMFSKERKDKTPLSPLAEQDTHKTTKIGKEAGVQCGVQTENTTNDSNETLSKCQTFPVLETTSQLTEKNISNQTQQSQPQLASLSTNSSITIESKIQPNNITSHVKILDDFTPFSWPKFVRAQEEFAKQNLNLCYNEIESIQPAQKQQNAHQPTLDTLSANKTTRSNESTKVLTAIPTLPLASYKMPVSRELVWKCLLCSTEHPMQAACPASNPKYTQLSVKSNDKPLISVSSSTFPIQADTIPDQLDTKKSEANMVQTPLLVSQAINSPAKTVIETLNTVQSQPKAVLSTLSDSFQFSVPATKSLSSERGLSPTSISTRASTEPVSFGTFAQGFSAKTLQFGSNIGSANSVMSLPFTAISQSFQPSIVSSSVTAPSSISTGFQFGSGMIPFTSARSVLSDLPTTTTPHSQSNSTSPTQTTDKVVSVSTTTAGSTLFTTTTQYTPAQTSVTTIFGQGFPSLLSSGFSAQTTKSSTLSIAADTPSITTPFLFGTGASLFGSSSFGSSSPSASFPTTTSQTIQSNISTAITTTAQSHLFQSISSAFSPLATLSVLPFTTTITQTPVMSTNTLSPFSGFGSGGLFGSTLLTNPSSGNTISTSAATTTPILFGSMGQQSSENVSSFGSFPTFGFHSKSSQILPSTTIPTFQSTISNSSANTRTAGFPFSLPADNNSNGSPPIPVASTAFSSQSTPSSFGLTPAHTNTDPYPFAGQTQDQLIPSLPGNESTQPSHAKSLLHTKFIVKIMVKVRKNKPKPEGWELIEPTLDELDGKMREAEIAPHEGKRKVETLWPIFKIHHQKSRFLFDLYFKRKAISKELYDYCIKESIADKSLIAQWKKQGYENLCCLRCIQPRDTNFGKKCVCRVPKEKLEEGKVVECVHCGCRGCSG
ncbi:unnamed protein product [Didymodactylos carnosus]|uniref:Protein BUD31 homolog n=1 Tax=Didymodactylos carnosus TaxID=1234261 RepID=A0A814AFM6_9BILA|nr:unnamed protein product [Didymodactylos carnosus]CAF0914166.1 unnamed protein product [Didymodactylos carnosus]CAF3530965.1 unnamed protein product [Didymodactylos carnosus]CAF3694654.1 unnamed protein product [Didymodactylos carnosus]